MTSALWVLALLWIPCFLAYMAVSIALQRKHQRINNDIAEIIKQIRRGLR